METRDSEVPDKVASIYNKNMKSEVDEAGREERWGDPSTGRPTE